MIVRPLSIMLGLVLAGCFTRAPRTDATSPDRCTRYELPPEPRGLPDRIVDTEATINPSEGVVTGWRLVILHGVIQRYRHERGALPDSLPAVLELGPPKELPFDLYRPEAWWFIDEWGEAIRFGREGQDYRLVSPGPDRRVGTADDVVTRGPCTGSGDGIQLRRDVAPFQIRPPGAYRTLQLTSMLWTARCARLVKNARS